MIILLHTSKTMRQVDSLKHPYQKPAFLNQATQIMDQLKEYNTSALQKMMHISEPLAVKTKQLIAEWNTKPQDQKPAIDSFLGDIYSGLRAADWSDTERDYANKRLLILSGLYGVLKPLDSIHPYRFEMGYKLDDQSMYSFWGDKLATMISKDQIVINVTSVEYGKAILPYLPNQIITPTFLTLQNGTPKPVVVHSKIARGAFARWIIQNKIEDIDQLVNFDDLNYVFDQKQSTPDKLVYVCKSFGGIGLSQRLS